MKHLVSKTLTSLALAFLTTASNAAPQWYFTFGGGMKCRILIPIPRLTITHWQVLPTITIFIAVLTVVMQHYY